VRKRSRRGDGHPAPARTGHAIVGRGHAPGVPVPGSEPSGNPAHHGGEQPLRPRTPASAAGSREPAVDAAAQMARMPTAPLRRCTRPSIARSAARCSAALRSRRR
jgi:hypothetical protein